MNRKHPLRDALPSRRDQTRVTLTLRSNWCSGVDFRSSIFTIASNGATANAVESREHAWAAVTLAFGGPFFVLSDSYRGAPVCGIQNKGRRGFPSVFHERCEPRPPRHFRSYTTTLTHKPLIKRPPFITRGKSCAPRRTALPGGGSCDQLGPKLTPGGSIVPFSCLSSDRSNHP